MIKAIIIQLVPGFRPFFFLPFVELCSHGDFDLFSYSGGGIFIQQQLPEYDHDIFLRASRWDTVGSIGTEKGVLPQEHRRKLHK